MSTLQAFDIHSPENPSILAVNYYPPMTDEEVQKKQPPRLHAHADMDVLTILYQRAGRLTPLSLSKHILCFLSVVCHSYAALSKSLCHQTSLPAIKEGASVVGI